MQIAYPYQKKAVRPVNYPVEEFSGDNILFRRPIDGIQNDRAQTAPSPLKQLVPKGRNVQNLELENVKRGVTAAAAFQFDEISNSSGGNGLSTDGHEFYIADTDESLTNTKEHIGAQSWQYPGANDVGDMDRDFDDDLEWMLTNKAQPTSNVKSLSVESLLKSDPLMNAISNEIASNDPFRYNSPVELRPLKIFAPPSSEMMMLETIQSVGENMEDSQNNIEYQVQLSIDINEPVDKSRERPRSKTPTTPKYYSWNLASRSPSRSRANTPSHKKSPPPKSPSEGDYVDNSLLLSKSLPFLLKDVNSVLSSSLPSATTGNASKKSVKGLTNLVFQGQVTASPYAEHLNQANVMQYLRDQVAHSAVGMSRKQLEKEKKLSNPKSYAIIAEDEINKAYERRQRKMQPANLRDKGILKLPPVHIPGRNKSKNSAVYGKPDDLYLHNKHALQQLNTNEAKKSRQQARLTNSTGQSLQPLMSLTSPGLLEQSNFINTRPISPEIIRAISPPPPEKPSPHATSHPHYSIDQLVTDMQLPNEPRSALGKKSKPKDTSYQYLQKDQKLLAMEMLQNTHTDPLYHVLREEIEQVQKRQALRSSSSTLGLNDSLNGPLANQYSINPSDIKSLAYFKTLPPAAWVTCRIIYYLLISYYEVVIKQREYAVFRKLTELEIIWTILEKHHEEYSVNMLNCIQTFTWAYLQELMKFPLLFARALDLIEHGISLNGFQWESFRESVHSFLSTEILPMVTHHSLADTLPAQESTLYAKTISEVRDQESIKNLYYQHFPIVGFQPLREMMKTAKGFLLSNSSSIYGNGATILNSPLLQSAGGGSGTGIGTGSWMSNGVAVPGSPLTVTEALTNWIKRIIALLYIHGTLRVRILKSQANHMLSEDNENVLELLEQSAFSPTRTKELTVQPTRSESPKKVSNQLISQLHQQQQNISKHLNFVMILDGDQYTTIPPTPVNRGIPAFFHSANLFVKPVDQLQVIITRPVYRVERSMRTSNDTNSSELQLLQHDLEQYLRSSSASPLHSVQILSPHDYQSPVQHATSDPNNHTLADKKEIDFPFIEQHYLQPGLAHCLQLQQSSPYTEGGNAANCLDMIVTEFHSHPFALPLIYNKHFFSENEGSNESTNTISDNIRNAVQKKLTSSVALINDSMSLGAGYNAKLRSLRYVVMVDDTATSWNAFQMACRLAKSSDSIYLVHIPYIQYWPHVLQEPDNEFSGISNYRPLFTMTYQQYEIYVEKAKHRRDQVISRYKAMGYNVSCMDIPSYFEVGERVLRNYSLFSRYSEFIQKSVVGNTLHDKSNDFQAMIRFPYFQYNEEMKILAKKALTFITSYKADFVLVGTNPPSIFNALSGHYDSSVFQFNPVDIESFAMAHYSNSVAETNDYKHYVGNVATDDGEDDLEVLFEERAVVLTGESRDHLRENIDQENEDDWRSAVRQVVQTDKELPSFGSPDGVDYELDSFIVEDECDHSLTATGITNNTATDNNSYRSSTIIQDQPATVSEPYNQNSFVSTQNIQQYQQYTEKPFALVDMLLFEAKAANSYSETAKESGPCFSFILVNSAQAIAEESAGL